MQLHHTPSSTRLQLPYASRRRSSKPQRAPVVVAAATAPQQQQPDAPVPPPPDSTRPPGRSKGLSPQSRKNISERIEQLKRQNESLKQAIGVFLDQPQDVGVVTGKPATGVWDEGGTATLLEQLRQRRAAAAAAAAAAAGDSPDADAEQQEGAASIAGASLDAAAADGSSRTRLEAAGQEAEAAEDVPDGPIFSTSMPGAAWQEPTAAPSPAPPATAPAADAPAGVPVPAAAAAVAAAAELTSSLPVEPLPSATAAAAASTTTTADAAAGSAAANSPAVSANTSALSSSIGAAAAAAAGSNGTGAAAAAAAAATVAAPPGVAAPTGPTGGAAVSPPKVLGTISERLVEMEKEHEAAAAAQVAAGQPPPIKPRLTARKPPPTTTNPLSIVFVSAEVAPWSKTGGLGDVMGALPQAMAERGHRVMVVSPRYTNGGKDKARYKEAQLCAKSVWVELKGAWHELKFHVQHKAGVDYVFVEHIAFERPGTPYGDSSGPFKDNLFRFALLCLGGLEAPLNLPIVRDTSGKVTDEVYGQNIMFVANDWHAALLPLLLTARFRPYNVYEGARCCLAIHNLSHQGSFETHAFHDVGLPGEWYGSLEWEAPEETHRRKTVNVLKAGIVTSDVLITVSQGYAAEITGVPQDNRIDMLLAQRAPRLRGIVNGVDVQEWDPASDKHLAATYSASNLSGKALCKRALQVEMRLEPDPRVPLIGFIGRLDYQKGPDLVLDALPYLSNLDCQVVILGTGAADYEARLRSVNNDWGWFARGHVGFSVPLGHRIIAGCDILLMPSRFEPCGLNQLYAMRYGTVPIAHATGGLMDTIGNFNPFSKGEGEGEGWTFAPAAIEPMVAAVSSAVTVYREQPERWRALQLRGMAKDCSWERAAQQYENVLTEAMADAVQYVRT